MARPQKAGLDYFPVDVGLLKDKKLRRPKMKYGYLAISVYIALLTLLYSDKGYYIPYETPSEKEDCIWYIMDSLQGKYQPEAKTIAEVIEELVACELFSGDRYPKNITSKRSQAVYYSATVERKSIVIDSAIWLLNSEEMKNLSEKHIYYLSQAGRPKNEDHRPKNEDHRSNNPQRKEKESKEKKNNEEGGDYACAREETEPIVEEINGSVRRLRERAAIGETVERQVIALTERYTSSNTGPTRKDFLKRIFDLLQEAERSDDLCRKLSITVIDALSDYDSGKIKNLTAYLATVMCNMAIAMT